MPRRSPTIEGFRTILRQPSLGLAEITWRWSFGCAAALLFAFSFLQYLKSLPVSGRDLFLFRTGQPALISQALAHILRGSAPRVVEAVIVLGLALAVTWMVIAALGRAVTLKALCARFEEIESLESSSAVSWPLRSLGGLNIFRAAAAVAAGTGLFAAGILGGAASPENDPSPGTVLLIFLTVVMLVALAWGMVNWFLSFATVFVVAEGKDTFGAMAAAADLFLARPGAILATSAWFGLAHLTAFFIASAMAGIPLAFAGVMPGPVVLGGVLLVTLVYFAVADFLYMGRLAAYVCIASGFDAAASTEPVLPPPNSARPPVLAPTTHIDPDELILSDQPVV